MEDLDFDALGAQYRTALESIAVHRRRQADAELALAAARRRYPDGSPEIDAALERVTKTVADVAWCKAVTIAAGEQFKGCAFEDVPDERPSRPLALQRRTGGR